MSAPVAVDCVVVAYNSAEDLPACLGSLADQHDLAVGVTVVDNCSSDQSAAVARDLGAQVIVNSSNRGFAAAVNQGLRQGSAAWVLILNPDAHIEPGAVQKMIDSAIRGYRVGCVGPKTTDPSGAVYPSARSFPGMATALVHGILGAIWPGNPATQRYHATNSTQVEAGQVDWVSGCCMLLPRAAWDEIAGFDERYFMYVEDMDLCFRLRKAGWRTVFEPSAAIMHVGGRSSRRRPVRSIYHHHRGAIRFYWRSAPAWHRPVTGPLATIALVVRGVAASLWTTLAPRR